MSDMVKANKTGIARYALAAFAFFAVALALSCGNQSHIKGVSIHGKSNYSIVYYGGEYPLSAVAEAAQGGLKWNMNGLSLMDMPS